MQDVLEQAFKERLGEIDTYLDLLAVFEEQIGRGQKKDSIKGGTISTTQQRILYSTVYLQLYNLVEATITKCEQALYAAISEEKRWSPADLSLKLRAEWVRYLAKTHIDQNSENRLQSSLELFDYLVKMRPIDDIKIEKGGGGNWHDEEIFRFAQRLGCTLSISQQSAEAVKKAFRDDCGALKLIVKRRNELAHGKVSFGECGADITVAELRELRTRAVMYLQEVVISFKDFIRNYDFLQPESRPSTVDLQCEAY